jgi:hypothetical protein
MKSFTDIKQSKKLAEILPIESADMWWSRCTITDFDDGVLKVSYAVEPCNISQFRNTKEDIPCWSLAALIDVLPTDWWGYSEHYFLEISKNGDNSKPNKVCYYRFRKDIDGANYDRIPHISHSAENLIDACINMIITLHEHKLLNK